MANTFYTKAKQALLEGKIDILTKNFKVLFVNKSLYTPNFLTNQFVSDIPSSAIVFRSSNLTGLDGSSGILDADDVLESSFPGTSFDAIIVYQVGASDASSLLFFFIDESEGLPFTGTGESLLLTLQWNNNSGKILNL
jgi:hypothetical protein